MSTKKKVTTEDVAEEIIKAISEGLSPVMEGSLDDYIDVLSHVKDHIEVLIQTAEDDKKRTG